MERDCLGLVSSSSSIEGLSDEPLPLDLSSFHRWLWRPASHTLGWPSIPSSAFLLLIKLDLFATVNKERLAVLSGKSNWAKSWDF